MHLSKADIAVQTPPMPPWPLPEAKNQQQVISLV
jgi:hypothetical protein